MDFNEELFGNNPENEIDLQYTGVDLFSIARRLCWNNSGEELLTFLKNNPSFDVNSKNDEGHTLLYFCALSNSNHSLKILLDHGADINFKDRYGFTSLHISTMPLYTYRTKNCMELLLKYGANINCQDNHGNTPLHNIATFYEKEKMQIFLDNGADISIKNNNGETFFDLLSDENIKKEIQTYIEDIETLDIKTPCEDY